MQIILTEEEYTSLKDKAFEYECMKKTISTLSTKFDELQSKYTKLLVFGVVASNERLKTTYDIRLN